MRIFENIKLCVLMSLLISSGMAYSETSPASAFLELQDEVTIDGFDYYQEDGWQLYKKASSDFDDSRVYEAKHLFHGGYGWRLQQKFYTNLGFSIEDSNIEKVSIINTGTDGHMWIHAFDHGEANELTNKVFTRDQFNKIANAGVTIKVRSTGVKQDGKCSVYGGPGKLKLRLINGNGTKVDLPLFHTNVHAYCVKQGGDLGFNEGFPVTKLISDVYNIATGKYHYNYYTKKITVIYYDKKSMWSENENI